MLDVLGKGYVIDHCIAFSHKMDEENIYKTYMTDALKVMCENMAKFTGGSFLNIRFYDIIHPGKIETRTSTEIINNISAKLANMED